MKKIDALPNFLTWLRVILIPLIVIFYYIPTQATHIVAVVLFIIAAVSDWLDGYFARKWNLTTKFGAFLDPVADKVLVSTALVMLVSSPYIPWIALPVMIIIGREIVVSALREWMAEMGKRASVAVSYVGKCKAACQMVAIIFLLYVHKATGHWVLVLGLILLYISAILTIWSMVLYLQAAWKDLMESRAAN